MWIYSNCITLQQAKGTMLRVCNKGVMYARKRAYTTLLRIEPKRPGKPIIWTAFHICLHTQINTPPDLPNFTHVGVV